MIVIQLKIKRGCLAVHLVGSCSNREPTSILSNQPPLHRQRNAETIPSLSITPRSVSLHPQVQTITPFHTCLIFTLSLSRLLLHARGRFNTHTNVEWFKLLYPSLFSSGTHFKNVSHLWHHSTSLQFIFLWIHFIPLGYASFYHRVLFWHQEKGICMTVLLKLGLV